MTGGLDQVLRPAASERVVVWEPEFQSPHCMRECTLSFSWFAQFDPGPASQASILHPYQIQLT